jgi:hypothetical protein
MMPTRRIPSLFRCICAGAFVLVLAGCTPGGQFDPTSIFDNDMFITKKKIAGDREPVFPGGVPGTSTGVPPDLVKGYQPPPDQTATDAAAPDAAAPPAEKPKPKPKVARVAPPALNPAAKQAPAQAAASAPTRISIGKPAAPGQQRAVSSQSVSPASSPAQQTAAPAASSQSVWPAPPQTAPQQQSSQSIWPNPPATGTTSQ